MNLEIFHFCHTAPQRCLAMWIFGMHVIITVRSMVMAENKLPFMGNRSQSVQINCNIFEIVKSARNILPAVRDIEVSKKRLHIYLPSFATAGNCRSAMVTSCHRNVAMHQPQLILRSRHQGGLWALICIVVKSLHYTLDVLGRFSGTFTLRWATFWSTHAMYFIDDSNSTIQYYTGSKPWNHKSAVSTGNLADITKCYDET